MPHSPRKTRSRVRQTDKRGRTLSSPSTSPPPPTMAGKVALSEVEAMITSCLIKDDIVDKLVAKLADRLRDTVVEALSESLRVANDKIAALTSEVTSLKTEINKLETQSTTRTDELEQYTRRNNIRVFGIPEVEGEDTDVVVTKLFRDKLKVDIKVERLDRSHRVGRKPGPAADGSPRWRPIIVRFTSYRDRRSVYDAKKRLKGTGVTIREDLTARRLAVLRAATDKFGVRNTWTSDGRVLWVSDGRKGMATCLEDIARNSK